MNQLILKHDDIDYKDHVQIITLDEYLMFLSLKFGINNWRTSSNQEKEIILRIYKLINLANDALYSDDKLNKLIKLSKHHKKALKKLKKLKL